MRINEQKSDYSSMITYKTSYFGIIACTPMSRNAFIY